MRWMQATKRAGPWSWYADGQLTKGSPSTSAYVVLTCTLGTPCAVDAWKQLWCTFAGGFAPVRIVTAAGFADAAQPKDIAWVDVHVAYPADGNMAQTFPYAHETIAERLQAHGRAADLPCTHLALRLEGSTDGFGRIIVYNLGVEA